jgi:hypothetical protein
MISKLAFLENILLLFQPQNNDSEKYNIIREKANKIYNEFIERKLIKQSNYKGLKFSSMRYTAIKKKIGLIFKEWTIKKNAANNFDLNF